MRRKELVEFRTPQHPSLGTNHWGGASPMLARNIPKESLEQRYRRLNSIRTHAMGNCLVEVRKLSLYLVDMICEGLGSELGYFRNETELTEIQLLSISATTVYKQRESPRTGKLARTSETSKLNLQKGLVKDFNPAL
ncbi:hypothetical protein TIFTF001_018138 [Ficus carica]|uniref:Uncharacterized protein n=1 Tax=Ficus carica TaxID=3494 RepID=A0AA88AMH4_FICCA|nr:hypothetical protein TIFTF001_018138 [Ficus carica]